MSIEQETIEKRKKEVDKEAINGIGNTSLNENIPFYNQAAVEQVIEGKNNSSIVLGRDRPAGIMSGYGGKGVKKAGSVDIVAGRTSAIIKKFDKEGNKVLTDPSMEYDAARVSVIQKTDVDENFNLPGKRIRGRSTVVLKADTIRQVARGGIKLVTNADKYDSTGELKILKEGVELIANDGNNMQAIPLGNNLAEVINDIYKKISQTGSELANIYNLLLKLSTSLTLHTHPTAVGPSAQSIELIPAITTISSEAAMHVIELQLQQLNIEMQKLKYLTPGSTKYINSEHHKLD